MAWALFPWVPCVPFVPHAMSQTMNLDRRNFLSRAGGGLGTLALAQLFAADGIAAVPRREFNGGLHHPAKVKRIIQLFMTGGASPMDTFDYKPALEKVHGQKLGPKEKPEGFTGMPGALMKSPFAFKQHGECGRWVSSVFPEQAKWVDDMAFLMAMVSPLFLPYFSTHFFPISFSLVYIPKLSFATAWYTFFT